MCCNLGNAEERWKEEWNCRRYSERGELDPATAAPRRVTLLPPRQRVPAQEPQAATQLLHRMLQVHLQDSHRNGQHMDSSLRSVQHPMLTSEREFVKVKFQTCGLTPRPQRARKQQAVRKMDNFYFKSVASGAAAVHTVTLLSNHCFHLFHCITQTYCSVLLCVT